ncbi:uncharacterized protein L201_006743 [Kwoniella dendrophila CBS 6074]|uniref:Protein YOP1 n=1 Tax=Kwoniella dendrophila CBS 6074 TaxID=1295534 RepID=A0AAX4K267_9TREE
MLQKLSRCTLVKSLSDRLDRPPSVLVNASIVFLLSVIILNPYDLSFSISNGFGLIPMGYITIKHMIESENTVNKPGLKKKENSLKTQKSKKYLDFWLIYGTSIMLENVISQNNLTTLIPFWFLLKTIWITWFLIGLLDDLESNAIIPKPLQLGKVSAHQSKEAPSPGSSSASSTDSDSASESPYPSSRDMTDDEDSESDHSDYLSESDAALPTNIAPTTAALSAITTELNEMHSPPISRTPEFTRNGKLLTPLTGVSPSSDLSSRSASGDDHSSDTSSIKATKIKSSTVSSDRGNTVHSDDPASQSDSERSYRSDDSNDVMLPPDTPLDELALRGKKTIELPSPQSCDSEDSDDEGDERLPAKPVSTKSSIKDGTHEDAESDATNVSGIPLVEAKEEEPKISDQFAKEDKPPFVENKGPVLGATPPKILKQVSVSEYGREVELDQENIENEYKVGEVNQEIKKDKVEDPDNSENPQKSGLKEGEVIKLSMEDLLAMDEGEQSDDGQLKADIVADSEGDKEVKKTKPLEVNHHE